MTVQEILTPDDRLRYNQKLLDLEKLFQHPFGDDYFTLDHGKDYFRFFDRLGKPYFFIVEKEGQVIAMCVAVLREIQITPDTPPEKVWYLCDLKVHPDHRGLFIVHRILKYAFSKYSKISQKVYGVVMNKGDSDLSRVVKFSERLPYLKLEFKEALEFYLLNSSQGPFVREVLTQNKGAFVSLKGIKDLRLKSTGLPLPLVHFSKESKEATHIPSLLGITQYVFCYPKDSKEAKTFKENNLSPAATANIVANFIPSSWDFIKSCDI